MRLSPTTSRRGFLRGSAAAAGALAALQGSRLIVGGGDAWALELKSLSPDEGDTLLRFLRDLFPHDYLPDVFYANALAPLDDAAAQNPATRELLVDGIADLNARAMRAVGRSFREVPAETARVAIVNDVAGSAFFSTVHGNCQIPFYNQAEIWPAFGFEGPSSPSGGYLNRGFNDLDWL